MENLIHHLGVVTRTVKTVDRDGKPATAVVAASALAQQPAKPYEPQRGQAGKDVIWIPTPQGLVDRMLEMAKVTPQDYVIDLGSGDGRTVITAAKLGAKAHGIEYNPEMAEFAKRKAKEAGVEGTATFANADIFQSDFSQATVVTLFLLPALNVKLRPIILKMKAGTRVVSNSFDMGDWEADQTAEAKGECTSYCRAFLWIVPASAAGSWKAGDRTFSFEQTYQMVSGKIAAGNVITPITKGRFNGAELKFSAAGTEYVVQVAGDTMKGTAGGQPFEATRVK